MPPLDDRRATFIHRGPLSERQPRQDGWTCSFERAAIPVGAVGVAGPRDRLLKRGREPAAAAAVLEAARGISCDLGAPRWPAG
jgi:hypothetical protein